MKPLARVNTDVLEDDKPVQTLSFLQMLVSILASFFGVQSDKNRKRDFEQGRPIHFIVAGVFMTVVWYVCIYLIVKVVLHFI